MATDVRNLTGSIVALVTPFKTNGEVDFAALDRLVDLHLQNGTDGILVLGTTGESSTMTDAEDVAVAQHVVNRVNGAIPIIGGAGSNSTEESLNKAKGLQMVGVDALLLITPYYNKSNEEGIYRHFTDVLDKTEVPSILYNIPGRTGCSISEANVVRLAEHPKVMGIKEASGSIAYATSVARHLSPDFRMYSGNDDMIVPILSLGGSGVISVWANVQPQICHDLVASYLDGDYRSSLRMQLDGLDLVHALFCEVNPIPVKAALAMMGLIEETYRMPLYPMAAQNRARLEKVMKEAGLVG
ncbi:MAG: 4-hydroxy-tetrahydrodipicolinate synthase [Atopobiaceae bacterium]|nr:4-hydroxy-tetrahydrodipicolinate synthase [Atopobiaceae bacterium]